MNSSPKIWNVNLFSHMLFLLLRLCTQYPRHRKSLVLDIAVSKNNRLRKEEYFLCGTHAVVLQALRIHLTMQWRQEIVAPKTHATIPLKRHSKRKLVDRRPHLEVHDSS